MKLESQVSSLEPSRRLKELNVKQDSYFVYGQGISGRIGIFEREKCSMPKQLAAYTTGELGEMLWSVFETDGWELLYKAYGEVFDFKGTQRIGELGIINLMRRPDIAAKMLIFLIENDLISKTNAAVFGGKEI